MKNYLRNLFVLTFLSFTFTACQNFFNSELKEKLDEAVEIANSSELTVEFNLRNSNSGKIVPQGILKVKRGEIFKFEFTVKNGYIFDGIFNVWGKDNGKNTKILNTSEVILFEKKSEYNAGVGSTNYSYEAKILKDVYNDFLINPSIRLDSSISHPEGSALPVIRDMKVTNRYGDGHLVDYFDLDLYVEDKELDLEEKIVIDFYDVSDEDYEPTLAASVEYYVIPDDIGNGNYQIHTNVDLRDVDGLFDYEYYPDWNYELGKYMLTATVDNAMGSASKSYDKPLKKQSYSKTQVQIYNYYNIYYSDPALIWNQTCFVDYDFIQHSTEFSKTLKLMVCDFDKDGFGFLPDGRKNSIKYGFCQNFNEIETLELNNVISDYNAFDFESEYNEMQPLWYEASQIIDVIPSEPDPESSYFYENGDKENGAFLENKYNEMVKEYNEELEKYNNEIKPHNEWLCAECEAGYQKYDRKGEQDKAIINIPFPSNIDPKKNIYIKVATDNGINGKKYEVFTISAPPKIRSIDVNPSEDEPDINKVNIEFFDSGWETELTIYNSPESENLNYTLSGHFDESFDKSYPFYVYSHNKIDYPYKNMERQFHLCSYGYGTYTTEKKQLPLKKISSDAEIEIKSAGKNTETHIISVNVDKDILNQFDRVFWVKYWFEKDENDQDENDHKGEWIRGSAVSEVSLSDDNKISFEEETIEFYDKKNLKERVEYRFEIMGVKDAVKYWMDSPFIITETDERIEDNKAPYVEVYLDIDWETWDMYPTNIKANYLGSFLTVESFPSDVGGHLDENTKVSIDIFRVINEEKKLLEESIELTNCPIDKYLNIPISDLKNGRYELELSISDTKENSSTFGDIFFNVDRKTVSMNEIEMHGSSFKIKNNDATSYTLNYFDTSKNSWGTPQKVELENGESSDIGKNGMFQLRFGKDAPHPADNNVSYPYLFHFPERKLNARDLWILRNSVRVFTDQPFFIHTIKSNVDWGNDVDAWENHQSFSYAMDEAGYLPFEGSEVDPVYKTGDYSSSPFIYNIPWDKLDKKYAAIVIIWGDNKRELIPIDMSKKY